MQKQEWVRRIETVLEEGKPYILSFSEQDKAPLLFACDVFRRRKHCVTVHFEPTLAGHLNLHVTINPLQNTVEITVKREDSLDDIISQFSAKHLQFVTVRGCGTVINTVCKAVQFAIHNGWFVDKTFMNTLVQVTSTNTKQRNTTLTVYLCRGSRIDSI